MRTTPRASTRRVSAPASTSDVKIVVGKTEFRAIYADSNALWRVMKARGRGTYDCVIVPEGEYSDYAGTPKVFGAEEIVRSIKLASFFDKSANDSDAWYNSLPLGAIIHYSNGFKEFVRCEVVMGKTVHTGDALVKCLKPIALVGEWREWDLPRRLPTGEIERGYHAKNIDAGETFRPHATSNYEHPKFSDRTRGPDPRTLKPIALTLPELSKGDETKARLNKAVLAIRDGDGGSRGLSDLDW